MLIKKWHTYYLLRPAAKIFINWFRNPTSTWATENWRKHNSAKQPMVDCTLESIQHSDIKRCVGKVIPHSNLNRQERPSKLGRSTPWYFELQWMNCGRSSSMSNSSRSRRKLAEETVIRVWINLVQHTKPSHTTSMIQRQETLIGTKPGDQIHLASRSWRWHSRAHPHTVIQYSRIGRTIANEQRSNTEVSTNILSRKWPSILVLFKLLPRESVIFQYKTQTTSIIVTEENNSIRNDKQK